MLCKTRYKKCSAKLDTRKCSARKRPQFCLKQIIFWPLPKTYIHTFRKRKRIQRHNSARSHSITVERFSWFSILEGDRMGTLKLQNSMSYTVHDHKESMKHQLRCLNTPGTTMLLSLYQLLWQPCHTFPAEMMPNK